MNTLALDGTGAATSPVLPMIPGKRYVFSYSLYDGTPPAAYTLTPSEFLPSPTQQFPIQLVPGTTVAFAATSATGGRVEFPASIAGFRFTVTSSAPNSGVGIYYNLVPID
jgi:hypothetical protein